MRDDEDSELNLEAFAAAFLSAPPPNELRSTGRSYVEWEYSSLIKRQRRLVDLATQILRRKVTENQRMEHGRIPHAAATIAEMEATLADLRQENEELQKFVEREAMDPNSRSSLERVMLVAIMKAYEAVPGATSRADSIATRLSNDALLFNMSVDPKTVRKYAIQAAQFHKLLE